MIRAAILTLSLLLLAEMFSLPGARAADRGDEVVVVYNRHLPESKEVADHYAAMRGVPARQVMGFNLPPSEEMSRTDFEKELQEPLIQALEERRLFVFDTRKLPATNGQPARSESYVSASRIRYAVMCYGVPIRILPDSTRMEDAATNMIPELRRNEAAVDSELALLPLFRQKPPLSGTIRNLNYGATNTALLHPTNGLLMVARLDGPTPEIARGLVDKALEAEQDGLWGRAYFDTRGLPKGDSYFPGDEWIRGAAAVARLYGFDVQVDDAPSTFPIGFPLSQVALYAGWYDGRVSGPFTRPQVEFMPGAVAYHLHSFSAGKVRTFTEFWVGPLLAKGATATMGSVFEPYLSGTPDLQTFFARLLLLRFTFGEAAYASQLGLSWQTTVIGDPLYLPFGRDPAELHRDLKNRGSPMLAWSENRVVNLNLVKRAALAEAEDYLHEQEMTQTNAVLLEKLAQVYELRGKPHSSASSRLKALRYSPTPQQEVRLVLTAIPQLLEQKRQQEALDALQKLMRDQPDHPDRLSQLKAALPIAQFLGQNAPVAEYTKEIARLESPSVLGRTETNGTAPAPRN